MAESAGRGTTLKSLAELLPGQSGEVVEIRTKQNERLLKLSALGVVPGTLVRLQQRSPAYIIWVGETQVSLDADVAREIRLRLLDVAHSDDGLP